MPASKLVREITAQRAERAAASAVAALLTGCVGQGMPAAASQVRDACDTQVIVELADRDSAAVDAAYLKDLGRSARVVLDLQHSLGRKLVVLRLRARDDKGDCAAALGRLRGEPGIRSVDLDTTRQHHAS